MLANLEKFADERLRAEFPLAFDDTQPVSVGLNEIQRALKLLHRDDRNNANVVAEMKRQLEELRASLTHRAAQERK